MAHCTPCAVSTSLDMPFQMQGGKLAQTQRLPTLALHSAAAHEVTAQMPRMSQPQPTQVRSQVVADQYSACSNQHDSRFVAIAAVTPLSRPQAALMPVRKCYSCIMMTLQK